MKTAKINQLVYAALMATLISVCAWITVPIGPVPFTLQTFGVFCALCTLGGAWGTVSVLVYLGLGLIGLPVFSGFTGGVGKLAGPTGGYLIGFIFAALAFWGVTALFGTGPLPSLLGMALGNFLCYAFGTAWFMLAASSKPSLAAALMGNTGQPSSAARAFSRSSPSPSASRSVLLATTSCGRSARSP